MAVATTDRSVTLVDIRAAREAFQQQEPRDLFYRAATELVSLALREPERLSVSEALGVLLQTWNKNFYRFHKVFDAGHFTEIENLLWANSQALAAFRRRQIEGLELKDGPVVHALFEAFDKVLGPVGAAKALHLLAPGFFPLWDRKIAKAYDVALDGTAAKSDNYWEFMLVTKMQCRQLAKEGFKDHPLKAIDEFNY
jgi:hypothetical protein